jgi:integrase
MRSTRNRQPAGLTDIEVHALLRAAGASSHGPAARNYAMVQLMLQAGLRVGEVATLQSRNLSSTWVSNSGMLPPSSAPARNQSRNLASAALSNRLRPR